MSRFYLVFTCWFVVLLACFGLANLATLQQPTTLKPFGGIGFPAWCAVWGDSVETSIDWLAFALNLLVALVVSAMIAWACAESRQGPKSFMHLRLMLFLVLAPTIGLAYLIFADWRHYIGQGDSQRAKFLYPLWFQFFVSGIVGIAGGGLLAMIVAFFCSMRARRLDPSRASANQMDSAT
jgi:hypothetical protein